MRQTARTVDVARGGVAARAPAREVEEAVAVDLVENERPGIAAVGRAQPDWSGSRR